MAAVHIVWYKNQSVLLVWRDTQNAHEWEEGRILDVKHSGMWSNHWASKDQDYSLLKAESSLLDSTYCLFCTVKVETLLSMHQTTWRDILGDWDLKSHTGYKNTCNDWFSYAHCLQYILCLFTSNVINVSKDVPVLVSVWNLRLQTHTHHHSKIYRFSFSSEKEERPVVSCLIVSCPGEDWKHACSQSVD